MDTYLDKIGASVRHVFEVLDDGIYITDKDGKTLFVNSMYERLTGLTEGELRGKDVRYLKDSGIFDAVLNPEIVKTGKPATVVQQLKTGKRLVLRGFPVFDDDDELVLVVTLARDITLIGQMRKQIAQQKEQISLFSRQLAHLTSQDSTDNNPDNMFYDSQVQQLVSLIKRIAETDATMLLLGETGVGKDWFARLAHDSSPRRDEMFLKVDCGSISENLIESELFGYAPGAFTGATSKGKPGHFEMANRGTVFLDEIGELPLSMQAKLLRVLQDQEVVRVGASVAKKVDVRIIAATNRNLEEEVRKGNFRSDLFYRLRVAVVDIPPLRERTEMIPGLVEHFLSIYGEKYKKDITCARDAMQLLLKYRWPGNIRELENLVQSLVVTLEHSEISANDLPPSINSRHPMDCLPNVELDSKDDGKSLKEIMAELERRVIQQALDTYGSVNKASEVLKVNRTTIFRKMKQ
jgi:PAS domain S-box-containing protein